MWALVNSVDDNWEGKGFAPVCNVIIDLVTTHTPSRVRLLEGLAEIPDTKGVLTSIIRRCAFHLLKRMFHPKKLEQSDEEADAKTWPLPSYRHVLTAMDNPLFSRVPEKHADWFYTVVALSALTLGGPCDVRSDLDAFQELFHKWRLLKNTAKGMARSVTRLKDRLNSLEMRYSVVVPPSASTSNRISGIFGK